MIEKPPINSEIMKASVIAYFRFEKQMVAVDEVAYSSGIADVLADDGKQIVEVEIKLTKSDLVNGERRKGKHPIGPPTQYVNTPNKFYLCVPEFLAEDAERWIIEVNPNYGLIVFLEEQSWRFVQSPHVFWGECLHFRRGAKKIHKEYKEGVWRKICMRASATLCEMMGSRQIQIARIKELEKIPALAEAKS